MSCPHPVGALGQGTLSTTLAVGVHSSLPTRAWVVGIMPDEGGGIWRLATNIHISPRAFVYDYSMLSPGGGRALFITHYHFAYLVSRCFFFKGESLGNTG